MIVPEMTVTETIAYELVYLLPHNFWSIVDED